jgi:acetyl-CoA C-acetyltransferase
MQAIIDAVMQVQTGASDLIVAGGVESMSQAEHYVPALRWGGQGERGLLDRLERARITAGGRLHLIQGGTLQTAETLRAQYGIGREPQDALAYASHIKAVTAQQAGHFDQEIVPVAVRGRVGHVEQVLKDEHPRPDISLEALATLKPIRLREDPRSTVTAGNASGQNDGAAACIVTTRRRAQELDLEPFGRLVSWATAGVAPEVMGIGAAPAAAGALARAGLSWNDIDIIELNEAFAAQTLAVLREWNLSANDPRLNPVGSGISLGHPVGATGARIAVTLLHALRRRRQRYGLAALCIAGGQGIAAVFETL